MNAKTSLRVIGDDNEWEGESVSQSSPADGVQDEVRKIVSDYMADRARDKAHERLFLLFKDVANRLAQPSPGVRGLQERAALLAAQSEILDAAATLPADDLKACVYKLALWRHDYVRGEDEAWPRGDIVAAAAFEDLRHVVGIRDDLLETDEGAA